MPVQDTFARGQVDTVCHAGDCTRMVVNLFVDLAAYDSRLVERAIDAVYPRLDDLVVELRVADKLPVMAGATAWVTCEVAC